VSRFLDHWKIPSFFERYFPQDSESRSTALKTPRLALFQGNPIWIHPVTDLRPNTPFVTDDGKFQFLPDNAIANVHMERYVARDGQKREILKKIYYHLKPMMTRSMQVKAQRMNARSRLRNVLYPKWPHDDSLRLLLNMSLVKLIETAGVSRIPFIGFWPRGCRWAACFTHDVEQSEGLAAMQLMAGIEEEYDIRSTWFIVPERYPVSTSDLSELRAKRHEIGIHGLNHDGQLFSSREEFVRRVPLINRYIQEWGVVGFRSPVLYRNADWMHELDIQYDSSFMDTAVLEPQPGGVSTVFPFHLCDGVVELPITMPMDHHLINLLKVDTLEGFLSKFRWVVERNGLANFLFHPDYNLEGARLDDYRQIVSEVCSTQHGWLATATQIAQWWERRKASKILEVDGVLRVAGPAEHEAEVWYAQVEGGQLVLKYRDETLKLD